MKYVLMYKNDDFIVEYFPEDQEYRVSYFVDGHYQDDISFKEYNKDEVYKYEGTIGKTK